MIPLGRRPFELRALNLELAGSRSIRTEVHVLNLEHDRLADLTDDFDDGQVNVDADGEITRSLTLSFLDRRGSYDFDSDSPADGALYADRMLQVRYCVKVPELSDWVEVPVFTGPLTKLDRAGKYVTVECQGKEILALGAAVKPMTIKKGTTKVDAIRRILRERGGEQNRNIVLPDLNVRLPKAVSLGRESQPWLVAQKIAASMNRKLIYDGSGRCRLIRLGDNTIFTFRDGTGGMVMTEPQVAFATDNVRNAVLIRGGKPKAKKDEDDPKKEKERGVRHFETAPRSHPLSPWRLGRPDAPRYLLEVVDNDKIRSNKEAREVAQRVLSRRLRQLVEVTFESMPVPHLEEEDLVRVDANGVSMTLRMAQFSLPLKHDQQMSVGFHKQVSVSRRRRNRR